MIVPDINLLLYAEINAFPQHAAAKCWWEEVLAGDLQVGLPAISLFGFIRLATNRRVFTRPMAVADALGWVDAWLERPMVMFLRPGAQYLSIAFQLLRQVGTGANLTTDVQIAAHAIEHNGEVHSNDGDFARFSGLRWIDPLAEQ